MSEELGGVVFEHIADITPIRNDTGDVREEMPQSRYGKASEVALNRYGRGPFCKFTIPRISQSQEGVYIFMVCGQPIYVGQCENLGSRINTGYGNISPKNCYVGGQQTNCRINNLIFKAANRGAHIRLLFHESNDRYRVEGDLIRQLSPEWNRSTPSLLHPR